MPIAPPASVPFRAAMLIQGRSAMALDNSSHKGEVARPARAASKSAPAEKTLPSPVRIKPLASFASRAVSRKSINICSVRAFALSGLFRVATQTGLVLSTLIMQHLLLCAGRDRVAPIPVPQIFSRFHTYTPSPWRAKRGGHDRSSPIHSRGSCRWP